MWKPEEITFDILYDDSQGQVITATIQGPGSRIVLMGEVEEVENCLRITGAHVEVYGKHRVLSRGTMDAIAQRVMRDMGYDEIEFEGAARTTGARKGSVPRPKRFERAIFP